MTVFKWTAMNCRFPKLDDVMQYYACIVCLKSGWRHDMEKLSGLLAFCKGKPPAIGKEPVIRSFDVSFVFVLSELLNEHSCQQFIHVTWYNCMNVTWYNQLCYPCYLIQPALLSALRSAPNRVGEFRWTSKGWFPAGATSWERLLTKTPILTLVYII